MATSFLDKNGLTTFWSKIKTTFALKSEIPDSTSDLTNDSGFITTDNLVQSDWEESDTTALGYILNKPSLHIGTVATAIQTSSSYASSNYAFAEGQQTKATTNAHSEGISGFAAGTGSHVEGNYQSFEITLTGDASATTYTYSGTINSYAVAFVAASSCVIIEGSNVTFDPSDCITITAIDTDNSTITTSTTLSDSALSGATYTVIMRNYASGVGAHCEGVTSAATGFGSHTEGNSCITTS